MKSYKFYFMAFLIALLFGCATNGVSIDTSEKRVALFESSYQNVLRTIILYKDEGRFSNNSWKDIQKTVSEISIARKAIYTALEIGNLEQLNEQLRLANSIMLRLRTTYIEQEASQ